MRDNELIEQHSDRRGGVRRGRKHEPGLIVPLNVNVTAQTKAQLKAIASGSNTTMGEVLDRLIARAVKRLQEKKLWNVDTKDKGSGNELHKAA